MLVATIVVPMILSSPPGRARSPFVPFKVITARMDPPFAVRVAMPWIALPVRRQAARVIRELQFACRINMPDRASVDVGVSVDAAL
jgi:hypothetical protein